MHMADEGDVLTDLNNPAAGANGADNQPSAGVISQYIKDLSVENPQRAAMLPVERAAAAPTCRSTSPPTRSPKTFTK